MDEIDKRIILELDANCRVSYRTLADKIGMTANAVKKRIAKMLEIGLIDRFIVHLAYEMNDADLVIALVQTDGTEYQETFINLIGKEPTVAQVSSVACGMGGLYVVFAETVGTRGLSEFGAFIRSLESVIRAEIHPLLYPRGKKIELTKTQMKVLRSLLKDARMPISEIASRWNISSRRIRKALQELHDGDGVHFGIYWNLGAGGLTEVHLKIQWDDRKASADDVVQWLKKNYPKEFWSPFISAISPILFARFIVDELEKAESISREVRQADFVKSVAALVFYSNNLFDWPAEIRLGNLLDEVGIE